MMRAEVDVKTLWDKAMEQVKLKVIHPTLWRTLEMAVPITVESGQFVIGFKPRDFHMSGHITSSEHKNAIEKAIREIGGASLSLRVIEGDSLQDWAQAKDKEARMQALKEQAYRKAEAESAITKSWEGLLETVGRRYAALPLRQLPQFRARYMVEMLHEISEAMDVLMPENKPVDEIAERSLARVIEKVGTLTETPSALIALELLRYRRR